MRVAVAIVGVLLAAGCERGMVEGSGERAVEWRPIGNVSEVVVDAMNVNIVPSDTPRLFVEADDNMLRFVEAKEEGKTLTLGLAKGRNYKYFTGPVVTLYLPKVEKISTTGPGSGKVKSTGLSGETLELNTDWGEIDLDGLDFKAITANLKQFGKLKLAGRTDRFTLNSDFPGETAETHELQAGIVDGKIESSTVTVWAVEELKLDVKGLAKVKYKGEPKLAGSKWAFEALKK